MSATPQDIRSGPPAGGPDLRLFPPNTTAARDGDLLVGGCSIADIAREYGTPALVIDEAGLRARAAEFVTAFTSRHSATQVCFASKAFPSASILGLLSNEGLHLDVASGNELAVAIAGGADPRRAVLHGNAKTDAEIKYSLDKGVEYIVIDNLDDIDRIARTADRVQPVLLRVTPGIAAHTHEANATGHSGSKFGIPVAEASEVIARIRREPSMRLDGLHAHIGSQIFDLDQFRDEVAALAGLERFEVYDLGGGLAARYVSSDPIVSVDDYAEVLVDAAHRFLGEDIKLMVEPGRSMVCAAGVSVYTVVTVKRGVRTHVAVDGGMGDNLEVSLYGQRFQPWVLNRTGTPGVMESCDLVGHHCESGDVLVKDAMMPAAEVGDLVVVPATGAYTFTMSNNYNASLRPPVVLCSGGSSRLSVRRETLADLLAREILPHPVAVTA